MHLSSPNVVKLVYITRYDTIHIFNKLTVHHRMLETKINKNVQCMLHLVLAMISHCNWLSMLIYLCLFVSNFYSRMPGTVQTEGAVQEHL